MGRKLTKQEVRDVFRNNLRVEMRMREWSVRKLAKASGVSKPTIVLYRSGSIDATITMVYKLARAMGCNVSDLLPL